MQKAYNLVKTFSSIENFHIDFSDNLTFSHGKFINIIFENCKMFSYVVFIVARP